MSLLRTFVISDIHTDSKENLEWIKESLETVHSEGSFSVLVVAGDVSDRSDVLMDTFGAFSRTFDLVLFTPGNHDVWITEANSSETSHEKHVRIRSALETAFPNVYCRAVSVSVSASGAPDSDMTPSWKVAFVPILGWHSEKFDLEPEIPSSEIGGKEFPLINKVVSDRSKAKFRVSEYLEERQAETPTGDGDTGGGDGDTGGGDTETRVRDYQALLRAFQIDPANVTEVQNWDSAIIAWKMDKLNLEWAQPCRAPLRIVRPSGYTLTACDISESVCALFRGETRRRDVLGDDFDRVVAYSHFLPFPFLNPEKRFLFYPYLAKVVGSQELGLRVLQVLPDLHIFGHTHFGWNATVCELLEGQGVNPREQRQIVSSAASRILECRFVQAPLGYPRERKLRLRSMMVGSFNSQQETRRLVASLCLNYNSSYVVDRGLAHWSDYYKRTKRDPTNTKVADYVRDIYSRQRTL
eukprot:Gregarina_sp_Pseudo_9__782@NODE_14_length_6322_cov_57_267229_g12_i0_p3_GENE_NODE_14_length_6322_cov_57_267229_g12_i0NODE_14_length_6322_cov_57_267229_g12_i0_p3_ORF_typecomplete_len468_score141_84Metallophos/PF00149_28/2_2e08Metallophos/PF00149_28/18Metallophos_2/PF12850_7/2_5e07Metallophos_2/PF12850_7/20DNA_pol_E_B/PF04042_16/0_091_NODE_14_length_6322_cov_57_267229_g12_i030344437